MSDIASLGFWEFGLFEPTVIFVAILIGMMYIVEYSLLRFIKEENTRNAIGTYAGILAVVFSGAVAYYLWRLGQ